LRGAYRHFSLACPKLSRDWWKMSVLPPVAHVQKEGLRYSWRPIQDLRAVLFLHKRVVWHGQDGIAGHDEC